jgi:hypothetical protein
MLDRELDLCNQDTVMLMADEVTLMSLCALVLRTLKRSQNFTDAMALQCVDIAREALDCHRQCIEALGPHASSSFDVYINW